MRRMRFCLNTRVPVIQLQLNNSMISENFDDQAGSKYIGMRPFPIVSRRFVIAHRRDFSLLIDL